MKILKTLLVILPILFLFTGSFHVLATKTTDNSWTPESFIFPSKLELTLNPGEEIHKNITVYIGEGHPHAVKIIEQLEAKYKQLKENYRSLEVKYEDLKQKYSNLIDLKQKIPKPT